MKTQKCSGSGCIHSYRCEHHKASKSKAKTKGRWIDVDSCVSSKWDGEEMIKPPFDKLLTKEEGEDTDAKQKT